MATVNVILRKRPNKDGMHPLQLRISQMQKSIRLGLNQSINLKYWDGTKKKIKSSHPNSVRLNSYLQSKIVHANNVIFDLDKDNEVITLEMIRNELVKNKNVGTVFSQCDLYFENLLMAGKFNRYSGEKASVNHLKRFRLNKDLSFEDLNVRLLERFKAYLLGVVKVSERSATNYLITIRTIFNKAIADDIVDRSYYPFGRNKIKIKSFESEKIGLDEWEVKLIEELELDEDSFLNHARNVWLFSFYFAGIRAGDLLCLRKSQFKSGRLYYTMKKNNKSDSTKIPTKAQVILDHYLLNYDLNDDLLFPDLSNVNDFSDNIEVQKKLKYRIRKLDRGLTKIGELIDLSKKLSMHIARHTFGNIAGDRIPIQKLQQLYRHSSITTTINYQKAFLYKGTDDALDEVLDF